MHLHFSTAAREQNLEDAADATGSTGWADDAVAIACYEQIGTAPVRLGDLLSIFVFQRFDARAAEFHIASLDRRWATRPLLDGVFRIAFDRLGLEVLRAPIAEANVAAIVAALKVGFRFDGRLRAGAADGQDAILLSLTRDGWFLPQPSDTSPPEAA